MKAVWTGIQEEDRQNAAQRLEKSELIESRMLFFIFLRLLIAANK